LRLCVELEIKGLYPAWISILRRNNAIMKKIRLGAISRNYFNMPIWIAAHTGMFEQEGLEVSIELYEPIDEVWQRLQDGRLDIALGVTEHIILDSESGGHLEIIGGNVNRLPFSPTSWP